MLRVHFSSEDLLNTRFAAAPAPLMELGLAVATMQRRDPLFDAWRHGAARRLPRAGNALFGLVPPTGAGPTFLDPVSAGLEDGLDAVLSSPTSLVRAELRRICAAGQPITPWIRALDERDSGAWRRLGTAIRGAHAALVASAWPRVWRSFRGEVAWRGRLIAEGGLGAALDTLHPRAQWRGTTLEIDARGTFVARPDGKGVTLLPSAFWTGRPLVCWHPDGSALIVYAPLAPLPLVDDQGGADPLAELLGRTRGAVLALAVAGRTTGQLARELGISAASASEHARTLRRAGLLVSERDGKAVVHTTTSLGDRLLHLPRDERTDGAPALARPS